MDAVVTLKVNPREFDLLRNAVAAAREDSLMSAEGARRATPPNLANAKAFTEEAAQYETLLAALR